MMVTAQELLEAAILIVDDQPAHVQLLDKLLRDAGYANVASTTDPGQVGALHRHHGYDLILLDLQMPGMDGFEVMASLRADDDASYLPVLVLAAEPRHKLRALEAGAKDFISKPFDLVEVKTRIHNMLEVRLLYRKLARHNQELEQAVRERTAELAASEERYRRFTELASDWYWEQNESGDYTQMSGPVQEMLGIGAGAFLGNGAADDASGWNKAERQALRAAIAARRPFLDFVLSRVDAKGTTRQFRVSGEPMFNRASSYIGYRGIGVEVMAQD